MYLSQPVEVGTVHTEAKAERMATDGKKSPVGEPSVMRQLGSFASTGIEFIVAVMLPGGLGYWLDNRWQTTPWLMLIGGAFGFGVGLYMMLRAAKQSMR